MVHLVNNTFLLLLPPPFAIVFPRSAYRTSVVSEQIKTGMRIHSLPTRLQTPNSSSISSELQAPSSMFWHFHYLLTADFRAFCGHTLNHQHSNISMICFLLILSRNNIDYHSYWWTLEWASMYFLVSSRKLENPPFEKWYPNFSNHTQKIEALREAAGVYEKFWGKLKPKTGGFEGESLLPPSLNENSWRLLPLQSGYRPPFPFFSVACCLSFIRIKPKTCLQERALFGPKLRFLACFLDRGEDDPVNKYSESFFG